MSAPSSLAATKWLRACPDVSFGGAFLDSSQWKLVPKDKQVTAGAMLERVSWVRLSDVQASKLASAMPRPGKKTPFLIRAVGFADGASGFGVAVRQNGDVAVVGGVLTRHSLPIERRAIIVWLDQTPRKVYLSLSAAE
jgi:hypothetical protein